ncbi:MAG: hypothetical protein KGQ70_07435 [Alphaproteobacteria bacterium]|nr:hypothetical protein [Alphaproteobacteria bacterium]
MSHAEILGAFSASLTLLSRANYFDSIFRGKTKPHAFSWFIWGVISSIGATAQIVEGAGPGAWTRTLASATNFIVVAIALVAGTRDIRRGDWITLAVALSAIPLWIATKTPVWSVLIVCTIDTMGYFPSVRKSWERPHQETARSYFISSASAFTSILAIEHYTLSTWLYPAVLTCSNAGMALFLLWRRQVLQVKPLET